jgi:hypothetical protein
MTSVVVLISFFCLAFGAPALAPLRVQAAAARTSNHRHGDRSAACASGSLSFRDGVASADPNIVLPEAPFQFKASFSLVPAAGATCPAPSSIYAVLDTYQSLWPTLKNVTGLSVSSDCRYSVNLAVVSPAKDGLFFLGWSVFASSRGLVGVFNVSIDVTCSASIVDWCVQGEQRYVFDPSLGKFKCVRTYLPCGIETAVGVPNPDRCRVYDCFSNFSCGRDPVGVREGLDCAICTPDVSASPACTPNCTNADNTSRVCGDDGCGGNCGTCPPGPNQLCGIRGDCIAIVPGLFCFVFFSCRIVKRFLFFSGTCSSPYPLFGNSLSSGDALLNPSDASGVTYFSLNNASPDSTLPVTQVSSSNRASLGWPVDQVSVPKMGARVRVFFDGSSYPNSVDPTGNSVGTQDVLFRFCIPATTPVQAMEAYLLAQDGSVTVTDTFLVFLREDCSEFNATSPPIGGPDLWSSDDATPPGSISSRVHIGGLIGGNCYLLDATYYSTSNAGPVWLEVPRVFFFFSEMHSL